jgi:leader peptidase (prepilin peptidase)/N-methyltransferase
MSISLIAPILIGWLAGYLVNYLADVLPSTRRFSQPACPHCNATFTWKDYLLLQPCPNGHSRKARTWIVQVAMMAISAYIWVKPPSKIGYILGLVLVIYLGIVFVIDMEHRLILHPTSIFGAFLGLGIGWLKWGLLSTLLGGLGGLLIMLAFYYFGVLFTRIRTKRLLAQGIEADDEEALGAGDVILVTILGFIVGWDLIWFCLLYGILLGGFVSLLIILWLIVTRKYGKNALMLFIPYGPYFITSAFLIIYFPKFIQMFVPGN